MSNQTYFVSDLHLFSQRSLAAKHHAALHAAASSARTFIFGGDIFDFRWSTYRCAKATTSAAIDWLHAIVSRHSNCNFHFILGNHDSNIRFVSALSQYASKQDNLQMHPYHLQQDDSVFLHGDAADKRHMSPEDLALHRKQWEHDETRGKAANLLYDLAVTARLHKVASRLVHPQKRVADRLARHLHAQGLSPKSGLRHVFFGHTHAALDHYHHAGLVFHNGGAPIAGLPFRIVDVSARRALLANAAHATLSRVS